MDFKYVNERKTVRCLKDNKMKVVVVVRRNFPSGNYQNPVDTFIDEISDPQCENCAFRENKCITNIRGK